MPSSFGGRDLSKRTFCQETASRTLACVLAVWLGYNPPRNLGRIWSYTLKMNSWNLKITQSQRNIHLPNLYFLGSAFLFSRVCRWYFCVVIFLNSFQRWPRVCNNRVSESEQWSESSMSTFRYEKNILKVAVQRPVWICFLWLLWENIYKGKKKGEMAKAMSLVGITNPYQILLLILMIHTHQPREDHRVIVTFIIDCFSRHLPIKTLGKVSHSNSLIWIYNYRWWY